ncbi:MAG: glycosyltransferase family 2 protein [Chloroflexota bacterium]
MGADPFFSIIVPVFNGAKLLPACLQAIKASAFQSFELIVVDDGSTDGSGQVAQDCGARVLTLNGRFGPAHARNEGATISNGRYLFFTDADCLLRPDTLAIAAAILEADPTLDALIGSYNDQPADPHFLSQYKNLSHHYIHQISSSEADTFWTGCGAIKRDRFAALGGFDARRYPRPSIEDIELGYRLKEENGRILLAKNVQVTHLKRWTFTSLLKTDVFDRAVPWLELIAKQGQMPTTLNLQHSQRASVAFVYLSLLQLFLPRQWRGFFWLWFIPLVWVNRDQYRFFQQKRGWRFTLRAIPLHWLYFFYSGTAVLFVFGKRLLRPQ